RIFQRLDFTATARNKTDGVLDRYFLRSAAALGAVLLPRVVYKNLSHQMRRDTEEVRTAFPIRKVLRDQPYVCFMYQRGGLQRRSRSLVSEVVVRQPAQFLVNQRRQQIQRFFAPTPPIDQKLCDNFPGYVSGAW